MSSMIHQQLKLAAGGSVGVPATPPVNQVTPPIPVQAPNQPEPVNADAGASAQKAMSPPTSVLLSKSAQFQNGHHNMKTTPRFLLQDLVKQAQENAMDRACIAKEAAYQMKVAAECKCGKDPCVCKKEKESCGSKVGSADEVSTEYAMKLASAIEYVLPQVSKLAAPQMPPPHLTEQKVEPGKGPGALHVMESSVGGTSPVPGSQGKATSKNTPPTHTGLQATTSAGPATQIPNDIKTPPGGKGEQTTAMPSGKGKTAEAVYAGNLQILRKMAAGEGEAAQRALAEQAGGFAGTNIGIPVGMLAGYGLGRSTGVPVGGLVGATLGAPAGELAGYYVGKHVAGREFEGASPEERAMIAGRSSGAATGDALGTFGGGLTGAGLGALAGRGSRVGAGGGALLGAGLGSTLGGALGHVAGGLYGRKTPISEEEAAARFKESSAQPTLVDVFLATIKQAEDAINPAQISAGPAVEPDATQSGQGTPPTPSGSQMVASNEAAIAYTKQQAKASPKQDMASYVSEPALSAAHDSTLQQAFAHTGDAGVKISSADVTTRVSAARALLERIAASADK